jgi:hypothetical protein
MGRGSIPSKGDFAFLHPVYTNSVARQASYPTGAKGLDRPATFPKINRGMMKSKHALVCGVLTIDFWQRSGKSIHNSMKRRTKQHPHHLINLKSPLKTGRNFKLGALTLPD